MKKQKKAKKSAKKIIILSLVVLIFSIAGMLLYSRYIATTGLIVKEYKITNTKISNDYHGLKIIHISDIHYGRTVNQKEFNNMVNKINILKPDIVILTGDLLDRDVTLTSKQISDLVAGLKKINAKINKYAIMGNHDFAHDEWKNLIEKGGFINLNDTYDLIYGNSYEPILISGMSTNLLGDTNINDKLKLVNDFLDSISNNNINTNNNNNESSPETNDNQTSINVDPRYKILVMHEPDFIDSFDYSKYDLILAGHSHNGQVRIPLIGALILPEGAKKYYNEHYTLGKTELYISSGMGTSTIDFRFLNRPSINLYRLTNR